MQSCYGVSTPVIPSFLAQFPRLATGSSWHADSFPIEGPMEEDSGCISGHIYTTRV